MFSYFDLRNSSAPRPLEPQTARIQLAWFVALQPLYPKAVSVSQDRPLQRGKRDAADRMGELSENSEAVADTPKPLSRLNSAAPDFVPSQQHEKLPHVSIERTYSRLDAGVQIFLPTPSLCRVQ